MKNSTDVYYEIIFLGFFLFCKLKVKKQGHENNKGFETHANWWLPKLTCFILGSSAKPLGLERAVRCLTMCLQASVFPEPLSPLERQKNADLKIIHALGDVTIVLHVFMFHGLKDRFTIFQVCFKTIAHMNTETGSACCGHSSCSHWPLRHPFLMRFQHDGGQNPQSSFWVKIYSKVYLRLIWGFSCLR